MSDLLSKLNEMEARHAAEIKEIREAIEKEEAPKDETILGGMFIVKPVTYGFKLKDVFYNTLELTSHQVDQLRAIEKILQIAYSIANRNVKLHDAFKTAERLGLKF